MGIADVLSGAILGTVDIVYRYNNTPWFGDIQLDAALSETHIISATATEHPVEDGADISDHVRVNQRGLRMEGFLTNTPIRAPLSHARNTIHEQKEFTWKAPVNVFGVVPSAGIVGTVIQGAASLVGADVHRGTAWGFDKEFDRVGDAFDALTQIVETGTPITIYSSLGYHENMVIENLETTEIVGDRGNNASILNSITFTCDCKQIKSVKTELIKAPIPAPTVVRAEANNNKGKQGGDELADGSKKKSIASSGWDAFTGALGL